MESFNTPWDSATRKVVNEAGLEKAPEQLMPDIMKAIAQTSIDRIKYQPLISRKKLITAILLLVAVFLVLVYTVPLERSYLGPVDLSLGDRVKSLVGSLKFSKTVLYGIGFLGLFLIQIPFLKRILDN